jgi:hypothetical protein
MVDIPLQENNERNKKSCGDPPSSRQTKNNLNKQEQLKKEQSWPKKPGMEQPNHINRQQHYNILENCQTTDKHTPSNNRTNNKTKRRSDNGTTI